MQVPVDRTPDVDDLLPDLDLGTVMRQRPLGLGSLKQVARLTIAVTVSWAVAVAVSKSQMALFAPVTTLMVVQSSAWTTLGLSIQRIVGTGIGVLVASIWVNVAGLNWWSFLIGVGASLLIARLLPWSLGGQLQIPVAVVFVLAMGAGSLAQDAWRVADVFIGGAIGLLAVFIYPPKPRPEPLESALRSYRDAVVDTLREVGAESGSHDGPLADGTPHDYVAPSRRLRALADAGRDELVRYVEGAHLNLRARGVEDYIVGQAVRLRRLSGIGVQVRGVVGEANRLYDRAGPEPALATDRMREVVRGLTELMAAVLGAEGDPVGRGDRARTERLAQELEDDLRAAADALVDHHGGVGTVLGSVTLLGRLDLIRVQLVEFSDWEG